MRNESVELAVAWLLHPFDLEGIFLAIAVGALAVLITALIRTRRRAQRSIQPQAGRMVIAPAYFTHTHRGCVPVSGDKYILTSWILLNRAEQLYGARSVPR